MKPKAFINLPQWVPVVWVAAILSIISFTLEIREIEWSSYVSLPSTIIEAVLWTVIMVNLHKRGNISPILIIFIAFSQVINLALEISDLIVDEEFPLWLVYYIAWVISLIIIIVNYSGAFRKYAIVNLVCFGVIFLYCFVCEMLDIDFADSSASSFKYLIYPLLALVYYPYQVLVEVFNENEEESVSVEPD